MATHPLVGTWLAGRAPNDISVAHWGPDGNMSTNLPTVGVDPDGEITYSDSSMGSWVPEGERGIHFVFTNRTYDASGAHTGYFTVEGHPVASEDGMSFWDDGVEATVTIRDPNGVIVQSFGGDGSVPPSAAYGSCPASPATTRCSPCSRTKRPPRRRPRHRPRSDRAGADEVPANGPYPNRHQGDTHDPTSGRRGNASAPRSHAVAMTGRRHPGGLSTATTERADATCSPAIRLHRTIVTVPAYARGQRQTML